MASRHPGRTRRDTGPSGVGPHTSVPVRKHGPASQKLLPARSGAARARAVRDLGPAAVQAHQLKLAEGRKLPHVRTAMTTLTLILYAWTAMIVATMNALIEAARKLGATGG